MRSRQITGRMAGWTAGEWASRLSDNGCQTRIGTSRSSTSHPARRRQLSSRMQDSEIRHFVLLSTDREDSDGHHAPALHKQIHSEDHLRRVRGQVDAGRRKGWHGPSHRHQLLSVLAQPLIFVAGERKLLNFRGGVCRLDVDEHSHATRSNFQVLPRGARSYQDGDMHAARSGVIRRARTSTTFPM